MMARSSKSQEENQRSSRNCSRRRQTLAMAHRVGGVVGGDARGGGIGGSDGGIKGAAQCRRREHRQGETARLALDRLAQLGAHEVGHTLGFAHNFAASTQDRASVMDYPPPRIGLAGGKPDLSDAYAKGIGIWDVATVRWLYGNADERETAEAAARFRYVQDDNARAGDTAHVWGGLWDDGADPVARRTPDAAAVGRGGRVPELRGGARLGVGGARLDPVRGQVQVVDGAQDVVHLAVGQPVERQPRLAREAAQAGEQCNHLVFEAASDRSWPSISKVLVDETAGPLRSIPVKRKNLTE